MLASLALLVLLLGLAQPAALAQPATPPAAPQPSPVGTTQPIPLGGVKPPPLGPPQPVRSSEVRVNTLWVVPELNTSWVEPLIAKRKPGGGLYQIDANLAQKDIAVSLADAVGYLRSNPDRAPGFADAYRRCDLFFMWEDTEQPRGGPSAGLAFAVAAYAAALDLPVLSDVALTGAVDRDGRVRAVAGLALKLKACREAGMRTLVLPAADKVDPALLDWKVANEIRVVAIDRVEQAFFEAFGLEGPRKALYDRLLNRLDDYRKAQRERRWSAARLALDEVLEIQPGDLSARRLVMDYDRVDMHEAGLNLFADAVRLERDGLPDEALRAVRRAWRYADEPTRERNRAVRERLERASLSAEARAQLQQVDAAAAEGDVVSAWRLLQSVGAKAPDNPWLAEWLQRWAGYAEIAATANAAERRPDDLGLQAQLAQVFLNKGVPAGAARIYNRLREVQPAALKWPLAEAYAWNAAKRPDKVAAVLRSMQARWSVEAALAQTDYGVELNPPALVVPPLKVSGNVAWSLVHASDGSGPPTLTVQLDREPAVTAPASLARLELDYGQLAAGPHRVVVAATDRFGNVASEELSADVPALDTGSCLRVLPAAPPPPAGTAVIDLSQPGPWTVLAGTRLRLNVLDAFPEADPTAVHIADKTVSGPPWRTEVETAATTGPLLLRPVAALPGGQRLEAPAVTVQPVAKPPVWLSSPSDGARVGGTVPVVLGSIEPLENARVNVLLDGQSVLEAAGVEPLRLNLNGAAAGVHSLQAVVAVAERRLVTPRLMLQVEGAQTPAKPLKPGALFLRPATLQALLGPVAQVDPAVVPAATVSAVRWSTGGAGYSPGQPPAVVDTALRMDAGTQQNPARLHVALGDALAFAVPPVAAELGADVRLEAGPLATRVWTPARAGTWRLTVAGKPLWLTVTEGPAVVVGGVTNGATLLGPVRLRLWAALPFERLTLVDGDRALGSWPTPVPALDLLPDKLAPGTHVLRALGFGPEGLRAVSPPVVVVR